MSVSVHVRRERRTRVSLRDNYLVCADVSAEIFLCLSSERASSATRPGLCSLDVLHCVRQLLVVLTRAVIKICVSGCVADDASCEPASEELTLCFRKLKQHLSGAF